MARNRGGGSSSRPRTAQRAPARPAAAAAPAQQHAPAVQQQHYQPAVPQQGMGTGMMGMMANGMALGAGSGMGHMAVNSLFGGGSSSHQPEQQQQQQQHLPPPPPLQDQQGVGVCQYPQQAQLNKCLQDTNYNASACQPYFDALKACQEAHQSSGF